jgi:Rhodopirellula transposase DDE domain
MTMVSRATGVSRRAIDAGIKELKQARRAGKSRRLAEGRVRKKGGGRKKNVVKDKTLEGDLERLVDPVTRGDPESPLRWTCKSVRKLAEELRRLDHEVSHTLVAELLQAKDYSLQANSKTIEGASHPDRNAQFEYISDKVKQYLGLRQPVISVDTKKKELVGNFKNGGRELRPKGSPEKVLVHDFKIKALGKVAPYGIYDIGQNSGWVNVAPGIESSKNATNDFDPVVLPRRLARLQSHCTTIAVV